MSVYGAFASSAPVPSYNHFMEKSSMNILQNICFWVMQMKVHHMCLEAYEGESIIKSQTKQTNTTKHK